MKKLFFALITATALLSFASCGNSGNSGNSVEGKAKECCEKMLNAKSIEEFLRINAESKDWYKGLSEEDKKVAEEVGESYKSKLNQHMNNIY